MSVTRDESASQLDSSIIGAAAGRGVLSSIEMESWSASFLRLKPVLNWANVCSPNILRTLRRTMIRFLIELLVRTVQTLLRSQLACNEMQASARTCGRSAADSMTENVG